MERIRSLRVSGSYLSILSVSGSLQRDSPAMFKRAFSSICLELDDTPDTLGLQSETQSENNDAVTHDKKDTPMASTATMTTLTMPMPHDMTMIKPEPGTQPPSDGEQDKKKLKKDGGSSSPDVAPTVLDDPEEPTALVFDRSLITQTQACVLVDHNGKIDSQVCCHIPMFMSKKLYLSFKHKESGDLFNREVGESKWLRIIQDPSNVVEVDKEGQVRVRADTTVTLKKKQHEEQCPEKVTIG